MFFCELSISELTLNSASGFKYTSNLVILGHNIQLKDNKKRWKVVSKIKYFRTVERFAGDLRINAYLSKGVFIQYGTVAHRNHSVSYFCLAIKLEMYYRHRKSQIFRDLSKSFLESFNMCSLELPVAAHISLMHRSSLGNQISVTCFCNLFGCTLRGFLSPCRVSSLHFLD